MILAIGVLAIYFIAIIIDRYTTNIGLKLGGSEASPIYNLAIRLHFTPSQSLDIINIGAAFGGVFVLVEFQLSTLILLTLVLCIVQVNNIRLIARFILHANIR